MLHLRQKYFNFLVTLISWLHLRYHQKGIQGRMEYSSPNSLCRVFALSQGNASLIMNLFLFCFALGFLGGVFVLLCSNTFEINSDKNLCLNTDYVSNYITFLTCLKLLFKLLWRLVQIPFSFPVRVMGERNFFIAVLYLARRTIHYGILHFFSIKRATNGMRALFCVGARIPACV